MQTRNFDAMPAESDRRNELRRTNGGARYPAEINTGSEEVVQSANSLGCQ